VGLEIAINSAGQVVILSAPCASLCPGETGTICGETIKSTAFGIAS